MAHLTMGETIPLTAAATFVVSTGGQFIGSWLARLAARRAKAEQEHKEVTDLARRSAEEAIAILFALYDASNARLLGGTPLTQERVLDLTSQVSSKVVYVADDGLRERVISLLGTAYNVEAIEAATHLLGRQPDYWYRAIANECKELLAGWLRNRQVAADSGTWSAAACTELEAAEAEFFEQMASLEEARRVDEAERRASQDHDADAG